MSGGYIAGPNGEAYWIIIPEIACAAIFGQFYPFLLVAEVRDDG